MRNLLNAAACIAVAMVPGAVWAQGVDNYPALKPVTVVVPNTPGGATESETRMWTDRLGENLGQKFVLDYKPGAGWSIGMAYLAKQKPDGYTLGNIGSNVPQIRLRYPDSGIDPVNGYEHISLLHKRGSLLVVNPNVPVNNVKELLAYAKGRPGDLNFAASGEGSLDHISGSWLMSAGGVKFTFIHYKNAAASYTDLLSNRVQLSVIPYGVPYESMVKTGKLRNLGTAVQQRIRVAPDVPTVHEQGVADFETPSFVALVAPLKTPPAIINRLHAELVKISKTTNIQQQLGDSTVMIVSSPEEARRAVAAQEERFRKLGQELNINFREN